MKKYIIVAVDQKWGIGKSGLLPWHIPEDLKRFKNLTKESICVMGYNTFKEIADKFDYENTGKFLKNRHSVVLTSKQIHKLYKLDETVIGLDLTNRDFSYESNQKYVIDAIQAAYISYSPHKSTNIFFIGGSRIFKDFISYVDGILLTVVKGDYDCDTFFPHTELNCSDEIKQKILSINTDNNHKFVYLNLQKNEFDNIEETFNLYENN